MSFGGFLALTSYLPIFENAFYSIDIKTAGIITACFSISTSLGIFYYLSQIKYLKIYINSQS